MPKQIRLPFGVDINGGIAAMTEQGEVDQANVITLITTQPGERTMRPAYGVAARSMLFENGGIMSRELDVQIREAAATYAPEISLSSIRVDESLAEQGRIDVSVDYTPGPGRLNTGIGTASTTVAVGG